MTIDIPIHVVSEMNLREHYFARTKRKKAQRAAVQLYRRQIEKARKLRKPLTITLTRVAPRKLDSDNLAGAFKCVRDEIAKILQIDDGDETAATWEYRQTKAAKSHHIAVAFAETREAT